MEKLLSLFTLLVVWKPPQLRIQRRDLDTAISDPFNLDAAALLNVVTYLGGGLIVTVLTARRVLQKRPLLPTVVTQSPLRWYFLYGIMAVVSGLYSSAPMYTVYFAIQLLVTILVPAWQEEEHRPRAKSHTVTALFYVHLLQGMAIVILYMVAPDLVGETIEGPYQGTPGYRLTGGIFEDYGASALVSGLFFLTIFLFNPRHRVLAAIGYAVSWLFLFLSKSRTVTFIAVLFFLVMVVSHHDIKFKMRCLFGAAVMMVVGILWSDVVLDVVTFITRDWEGIATLTGRTVAFSFLMEYWWESPVWGTGYAAGTRVALMEFVKLTGWGIGGAHDALSKVLVELGVLGLFPLVLAFILAWKELISLWRRTPPWSTQRPLVLQLVCLMLWVTSTNFISGGIAGTSAPFAIVLCVVHYLKSAGIPVGQVVLTPVVLRQGREEPTRPQVEPA
jgi:hypothetical protein